ncbi:MULTISPECIES: hypothetical protein [Ensifer]|uniref:hypothetical protein n=1 Tax=Ensifer TaxID=106591 RepID=UPI000DC4067F|nr:MULTISPECIES: hypothetical protein [Ensifer]MCY1745111.1 hypothetical protein [Ensifer sp. SL37]RAS02301.1 hypothetical protein DEU52_13349 [Ensifer adhaerens]
MKTITLTDEQYAVLRALLEWTCGHASDDDGYLNDEDDRGHSAAAQIVLSDAALSALGYRDPDARDDPRIDEEVTDLVFSLYDVIVEAALAETKAQGSVAPSVDGCFDP